LPGTLGRCKLGGGLVKVGKWAGEGSGVVLVMVGGLVLGWFVVRFVQRLWLDLWKVPGEFVKRGC